MGGGAGFVEPINRDENRYWTGPALINTVEPTNQIRVTLVKTIAASNIQKYLILGVYVTPNPNENFPLYGYDRIMNFTYPTAMDNGPPVKGNMIENSSFEVGTGHGWGILAKGYERNFSLMSLRDETVAYHGKASLRLPIEAHLYSRVYTVKPNKKYTLSMWVRSTDSSKVSLSLYNVSTPPKGFPSVQKLSQSFSIDRKWRRVSLSGYLVNYPNAEYQIDIHAGPNTWIDAMQLEEGDLSGYAASTTLEVGLLSNHSSNIFYDDEPVLMDLMCYNDSGDIVSRSIRYEIYDYLNRKMKEGTRVVTVPAHSDLRQSIDFSLHQRGIFRVVFWVEGEQRSQEEVVFSVLPRPSVQGLDGSSAIGIHPNLVDYQLEALQKMGMKWARALSPAAIFRWSNIEPTEGQLIWHDDQVQKALVYGMTILGTIGTNNYWPAWADKGGLPDLDKWEQFVKALVTHYKDRVKYWEIWNEPIYVFTTSFYADMLKRAGRVIRRVDPSAKIVAMGGTHSKDWILEVLNHLGEEWRSYVDIVSTHLYPSDGDTGQGATAFKQYVIDVYKVPVWNTETGVWDEGFYKGKNSNFVRFGEPFWPSLDSERYHQGSHYGAERMARNFLHSTGNGFSGYFYYDSRIHATPNYLRSHPTIMEYDDTIRSKGVAYAVLAHFFDHAQGLGNISPDPNTYAYLFSKGGKPLVAMWAHDKKHKVITLPIAGFKAYDMMGNKITLTGTSIPYNRRPVYIEGAGISVEALRSAFQAGRVADAADNLPPNLSIEVAPTGPMVEKTLQLRWIAIDESSIPSTQNPDAILYSYKLEKHDSAWSAWIAATYMEYNNLAPGAYTFLVKAKDAAGNVSEPVRREIRVHEASAPIPPPPKRKIRP